MISLWVADAGISALIQYTRLHRTLTTRLEAAFGRPVEVRAFEFSLWAGPTLEAQSVTVGEDPRFGHEYFMHAESLTIRLHWLSLLRGHLELGTLSLSHPSLNLVRNASGDWNLEEWLPRPAVTPTANSPVGPVRSMPPALHFRKIEIDGGRINFKYGDEKLPFAFVNVAGAVETESPGRWRMDLDATPMRAAVVLQQAGTVHLTGHVGGTSSRLRPALLELSWKNASITDVLRLARSYDYGVHGILALSLGARTEGDAWLLNGRAELRQIHRWDLALRPDNPSVNLIAQMKWNPLDSELGFDDLTLEALNSNAHFTGRISWNQSALAPPKEQALPVYLNLATSQIDMKDVLSWVRAFRPGIADDASVQGWAGVRGVVTGWPVHVVNAVVFSDGISVAGGGMRRPLRLGQIQFRYDHEILSLLPVSFSWEAANGPPGSLLHMDISTQASRHAIPVWHVSGGTTEVRDIVATAGLFGWNITRGWDFAGPFRCDLRWQSEGFPWRMEPTGNIVWGGEPDGGTLRVPFLNQPIEGIGARVDFKPLAQHVTLSSAQAFGAHWSGTFDRSAAEPEWQFAVSADHLTSSDLDLWMNPRWRESFLGRMLPFLNPQAPLGAAAENLQANGRLDLGELSLASFHARHLRGDLRVEGRRIEYSNVTGELSGGTVSGSLDAGLVMPPAYHVGMQFERVDLGALAAASPTLANLFAGSASGEVSFHARGASRADLLASLECQGTAQVSNAELRNINLADSVREGLRRAGTSTFREASAAFSCANQKLQFRELKLASPAAEIDGAGSVDFGRGLDFRLRVFPSGGTAALRTSKTPTTPSAAAHLTGTLSAPQLARFPGAAQPR